MTTIQRGASLHEGTVQAIARGDVKRRTRRGSGPHGPRRVLDGRNTKVDPLIWRLVRENGIDHRRVEILDDLRIVIWNNSGPWPKTPG